MKIICVLFVLYYSVLYVYVEFIRRAEIARNLHIFDCYPRVRRVLRVLLRLINEQSKYNSFCVWFTLL